MSPSNANPGAGGVGVHGISKSDAASPSRNQPPAQSNPATSAAVARFLLEAADALNVKVGFYGTEVITVSTTREPLEVIRALERALVENKKAVIAAIQHENGGGAS